MCILTCGAIAMGRHVRTYVRTQRKRVGLPRRRRGAEVELEALTYVRTYVHTHVHHMPSACAGEGCDRHAVHS